MNQDRHIRLGGLIVGRLGGAMDLRLVVNWHGWSRWCRSGCLRGLGSAETFLPDQHANQEGTNAIPIMAAGEVKFQWVSAGRI